MEQPLNFLSFLSKDCLASYSRSFTFLGSGGPWRSVSPPDGGSVGGQLCYSHISPPTLTAIPPPHSTVQLKSKPDFNKTLAMWFRSSWRSSWDSQFFLFSTGEPCTEVGQFLWHHCCRRVAHFGFSLCVHEDKIYLHAEKKLAGDSCLQADFSQ